MELFEPFPLSTVSQGFGENDTDAYAADRLKGHTSIDFDPGYGLPVRSCATGRVYSVINKDNPDPTRYRAVYQIVHDGEVSNEVSYGHLDQIFVTPGQMVQSGTIIGTVGNTGEVYHNGIPVTKAERQSGSHSGAHLHGPQVRPCRRVWATNPTKQYLNNGYGIYRNAAGQYYEVIDYGNGYNGCVAPSFNGRLASSASALSETIPAAIRQISAELSFFAQRRSAPPTAPAA